MWLYYSLFFAVWTAVSITIQKRLVKNADILILFFLDNLIIIPFDALVLFMIGGFSRINPLFLFMIALSTPLNIIAYLLFLYAIKRAPISLLDPLSSFNPVLVTLFAFVFLGEQATLLKIVGIITVVIGTYLLDVSNIKKGFFTPITTLAKNKMAQLYFLTIVLWSITPLFEKIAIKNTMPTSPLLPGFFEATVATFVLLPLIYKRLPESLHTFKLNFWFFLVYGLFSALGGFAAFSAFSETNLGYAIAIFKLSAVFTVIFGGLFFKEKHIKERLLGAAVMILGAILLAA